MKKQCKVLFFVAMLVMLVVVTMLMTSAALVAPDGIDPETGKNTTDGTQYPFQILDAEETVVGYQATLDFAEFQNAIYEGYTIKLMCDVNNTHIPARSTHKVSNIYFNGNDHTVELEDSNSIVYVNTGSVTFENFRLIFKKNTTDADQLDHALTVGNTGKLIFKGKNTIIHNANGVDYTKTGNENAGAGGSFNATKNDRAWLKVTKGEVVFDGTETAHTTVHQIGHGGGIFVTGGIVNATYLTITNLLEGYTRDDVTSAEKNYTGMGAGFNAIISFGSANTGTSTFKNCEFKTYASKGQAIRFYGAGTYNFIDCEGNSDSLFNLYGGATVNVYGGTYTARAFGTFKVGTKPGWSSASSVFAFKKVSVEATLNIYDATFEDCARVFSYDVSQTDATSAIKVYGGTVNRERGRLVYDETGNCATLAFMPVGSEYTDKVGNPATLAAATVFDVEAAFTLFTLTGTPAVTVTLGDGVVINLNGENAALEDLGDGDVVTYGAVTVNFKEGAALPTVDATKFKNCTFAVTGCPAEVTLTGGTYDIDSVAKWFTYVKESISGEWIEGVNVTAFTLSGVEESAIPLIINGATVNITGGSYTDLATLLTLNSGALNISGGEFDAAAGEITIIKVNGGTLTISGSPCFTAEDFTSTSASTTGLIHVTGGVVNVACDQAEHELKTTSADFNNITDANFVVKKNGVIFYIDGADAQVTVTSGVFFRKSDSETAEGNRYNVGAVFHFAGAFTTDVTTSLNINGGYYYANSLVRMYLIANSTGKTASLANDADLKTGVTITVTGGTFVSNVVDGYGDGRGAPFRIARAGKHTITFPAENNTFMAYAENQYSDAFFTFDNVKGVVGTTLNVQGGEFEIANGFIVTSTSHAAIYITLKNITVTQTGNSGSFIAFYSATYTPDDPDTEGDQSVQITVKDVSKLTIEKVTFITAAESLFLLGGNAQLEITSGSFVTPRLFANLENTNEVADIKLNGGVFVITGEYAEGDSVFGDYKNVTINETVVIAAPEGTVVNGAVTLGKYAPDIYYGEDLELKVWVTFVADVVDGVILPVLQEGASLYLGENQNSTTEADCGIKFKATLTFANEEQAEAFWGNEDLGGFGIILAPADYVVAAGAFTIDALDTLSGKLNDATTYYVSNVLETMAYVGDETSEITFAVALYNLNNTKRAIAAIPYVCISGEYYYGAFDTTVNARSAEQIAFNMYDANDGSYNSCAIAQKYYPAPVVGDTTGSEEQ